MTDLRIGVIGAGGRGRMAAKAHRPGEGSRVVAICDTDGAALAERKATYGEDVFATSDYRELLQQDLDAVFVCTPDFLHAEHGVAALETSVAVYMEKPLAITVEDCDRLLHTAREHGDRLFVGHNMRHMAPFKKMKAVIEAGEIGEVKAVWCRHFISYGGDAYFRDWHSERKNTTGLLLQKGAHDIDVIHWLAGGYTTRVSAFGKLSVYDRLPRREADERGDASFNKTHWPPMAQTGFSPVIDVEDQNVVNMELDNGVLAAYLQCHFTPDACRNYTVIGTAGRIENLGDGADSPLFIWNRRTDGFQLIGDEVVRGEPVDAAMGHGGSDQLIADDFVRFARGEGDASGASPLAARMSAVTGCMATKSLREGGTPYDIPPVD